jgi:hypothetical protein
MAAGDGVGLDRVNSEEHKVTSINPWRMSKGDVADNDDSPPASLRFDMTKYLFVSKQVAKLFPTLLESQIILKYMSEMPDRVLTGPWRDNLDIVYARDGFINSWKASTRKYWREGGYRRDVKETIKWVGSLPAVVQRLLVGGWVVASMFALWYFLHGWIEWSGIWWFAVSTTGATFFAFTYELRNPATIAPIIEIELESGNDDFAVVQPDVFYESRSDIGSVFEFGDIYPSPKRQ